MFVEGAGDAFFRINERKLNALFEATQRDMERAEWAVRRLVDDQYRKTILDAQVYADTGTGTPKQAVDMAVRDFLKNGIDVW